MKAPKLRFKADDGSQFPDWEECTINDIFEFFNGKAHENIICEDGKYIVVNSKFISTDGMVKKYTDKMIFRLKKNDIVMVMSDVPNGKAMSKCFLIDKDDQYTLNQRICCLRTKGNSIFFINQISRNKYFLRFNDGIKQTNLRKNDVLSCPVFRPCLAEQQKIADFLSTIDTVIEKQKEIVSAWEERKKGVMQKLFSQEVRFKADDGSQFPDWEEKKLSEMFKKIIEKDRLDLPPLTIVQGYGTIRRDKSERRITYDEKGLRNYKAVQKDDFIVHLRSFEGGLEIANQDGIVSPAYHVYRGNSKIYPPFYYPYFRSSSFIKSKLATCVSGVRDGKNIEKESFDKLLIPYPCLAEQQKIADCLSSLDDVIAKQKTTLATWEELKKGLLQQMFI